MEDPTSPTTNPSTETASPQTRGLAQSLGEQRRQIEEFLASRRERMDGVESQLSGGLARIIDELNTLRDETKTSRDELDIREARLQQDAKEIEQMHADLDAARTDLDTARADLDAARAEWNESRQETEKQHSLLLEQIQKQQQEQQTQLRSQLEETAQRQAALDEAREAFHLEREQQPHTDPDSERELQELRTQCDELRLELEQRPQSGQDNSEAIERLTAQRDAAVRNQEEAEQLLAQAENKLVEAADHGEGSEGSEYKQRYELSLEDIRELREENKELQEELTLAKSRPQASGAASGSVGGPMSWEAQKQQLIASLESDYDENDPEDVQQRMQIEDVVHKTQLAISEKDDEIQDLKKLLENQSENIGSVTVGAAAFGEILDNDQIIQEERESLKQLKEEMRKKLSAAEIELSLERAKMARQCVEIEEKMRQLAQQQPDQTSGEDSNVKEHEKPARGKWLSRLGLNDTDQ